MSPDIRPEAVAVPVPRTRPTATVRPARGGTPVLVRPLTADDKPILADGFRRLSERARYLRFLAATERLSSSQLAYLAEVDQHDHLAWGLLAGDGETALGVGRAVRSTDDPVAAEVAVTIVDDHQGRGLGRLLVQILAVAARSRGIGVFHFDVLSENVAMNGLLASLGARRVSDGELAHHVLDVSLVPPPDVVTGDLVALLDDAAREAVSPGPDPG